MRTDTNSAKSVKPASQMKRRLLNFQLGYDLLRPFDRKLIADRAFYLAKSLNSVVDR
jgi:hypothetical protein